MLFFFKIYWKFLFKIQCYQERELTWEKLILLSFRVWRKREICDSTFSTHIIRTKVERVLFYFLTHTLSLSSFLSSTSPPPHYYTLYCIVDIQFMECTHCLFIKDLIYTEWTPSTWFHFKVFPSFNIEF